VSLASTFSTILKILFLLLFILALILGGTYWFDYLGLLDYKKVVGPFSKYFPAFMQKGEVTKEDHFLLEKELLKKKENILEAKNKELELKVDDLKKKELELKEKENRLVEEKERLEEEKKLLSEKLNEYDNYKENIKTQAKYFTNMPPKEAVERFSKLGDLLAIDILRQIDKNAEEEGKISMVPYYLSLMDPERAATIQRKMTKIGRENL